MKHFNFERFKIKYKMTELLTKGSYMFKECKLINSIEPNFTPEQLNQIFFEL